MKVEVQELGSCERRLEIEVAPESVQKELDQAYRELAKRVSIRGCRKGKIPRAVLERYHRGSVEDEVMQKLIPDSFQQAVKDQGLRAVGQPKLDDINLNEAKALRFTAIVEVLPEINLQTSGGWDLTKEVRVVTEADVERELQELQNRHVNVIALGGGTWMIPANRTLLALYDCRTLWLDTPFETCWHRIAGSNTVRPLAPDREAASKRFDERREQYSLAERRIPVEADDDLQRVVGRIFTET